MSEKKSINFTVVPDEPEDGERIETVYANFGTVSYTPFDFTLTFCEMQPVSEKEIADAADGETKTIRAPVKVKIVLPAQAIPALGAVLSENLRNYQTNFSNAPPPKGGKVH